MFVKYCGFTREEDLKFAVTCSIQAVGFVFYPPSKRYITPERAAELSDAIKDSAVKKVGLFVDADIHEIKKAVALAKLDMAQLYDRTLFDEVHKFIPVIRTYRIKDQKDISQVPDCPVQDLILLDSFHPQKVGGTGHSFNWDYLKNFPYLSKTLIAGGIKFENIDFLLTNITPYGIDLSSGIEDSPGKKSHEKMKLLIQKISRY